MEWVEMTGKTVEEAVEAALDQLGVAEADAEVVVVEEPKSAMFGLRRSSARIRARVRPVQPRAKRPSRRSSTGATSGERGKRQPGRSDGAARKTTEKDRGDGNRAKAGAASDVRTAGGQGRERSEQGPVQNGSRSRGRGGRRRQSASDGSTGEASTTSGRVGESQKEGRMSIETQQELAGGFVRDVVARFGIEATTTVRRTEDDGIYISVEGENLGLLVGPKGATVEALQELTRTVVQRHTEEHTSRIVVDVGGYRERRAAALRQFVTEAAADVLRTGSPEALEPMSPSDRKIVHDTVNDLEGLETTSEGVEPRRYVVIRPASAQSAPEPSLASEADDGDLSEESADLG
jgi:spoIIIJ-associated protein